MTARPATTPDQKLAEDLAFAYRGFMRGCDTGADFDIWYYGTKLIEAQDKLGFDMVENDSGLRSLIASAHTKLSGLPTGQIKHPLICPLNSATE
jgi:hypothetical protein